MIGGWNRSTPLIPREQNSRGTANRNNDQSRSRGNLSFCQTSLPSTEGGRRRPAFRKEETKQWKTSAKRKGSLFRSLEVRRFVDRIMSERCVWQC